MANTACGDGLATGRPDSKRTGPRTPSHSKLKDDQYVKKPERRPHPLLDRDSPYKIKRNGMLVLKHDGTPVHSSAQIPAMGRAAGRPDPTTHVKRKATTKPSSSQRLAKGEPPESAPSTPRSALPGSAPLSSQSRTTKSSNSAGKRQAVIISAAAAGPDMSIAVEAIAGVSRQDMTELKHIKIPSPTLKMVLEAALVITGMEPPLEWRAIKVAISRSAFMEQLQAVRDPADLPAATRKTLRECLEIDGFTYEHASRSSSVCGAFFLLIEACASPGSTSGHDAGEDFDSGEEEDEAEEDAGHHEGESDVTDDDDSAATADNHDGDAPEGELVAEHLADPIPTHTATASELARQKRSERLHADTPATQPRLSPSEEAGGAGPAHASRSTALVPTADVHTNVEEQEQEQDADDDDVDVDVDDQMCEEPVPRSTVDVVLHKQPGDKLGFSVREGHGGPNNKRILVFVSKVTPNELADRSGQIKVGQQIVRINGNAVEDCGPKMSKLAAVGLIKSPRKPGAPLVITLTSDVGGISEAQSAAEASPTITVVPPPPIDEVYESVERMPESLNSADDATAAPGPAVCETTVAPPTWTEEPDAQPTAEATPHVPEEVAAATSTHGSDVSHADHLDDVPPPMSASEIARARRLKQKQSRLAKATGTTEEDAAVVWDDTARGTSALADEHADPPDAQEEDASAVEARKKKAQQDKLDQLAAEDAAVEAQSAIEAQKADETRRMALLEVEVARLKAEREELDVRRKEAESERLTQESLQEAQQEQEKAERSRMAAEADALRRETEESEQKRQEAEKGREEARQAALVEEQQLQELKEETERLEQERAAQLVEKERLAAEAAALKVERNRYSREMEEAAMAVAAQKKEHDALAARAAALVEQKAEQDRVAAETEARNVAHAEEMRLQREEHERLRDETKMLKEQMAEQRRLAAESEASAAAIAIANAEATVKAERERNEARAQQEIEITAKIEAEIKAKLEVEMRAKAEADAQKIKAEADANARRETDAQKRENAAKREEERRQQMDSARELVQDKEREARRSTERLSVEARLSMESRNSNQSRNSESRAMDPSTDTESSPPPVPLGSPPPEPSEVAEREPAEAAPRMTPVSTAAAASSGAEVPEWKKKLESVRQLREQRQQRDSSQKDTGGEAPPKRSSSSSEALAKARERVALARLKAAGSQTRSESAPVSASTPSIPPPTTPPASDRAQALRLARAKADANGRRSGGESTGSHAMRTPSVGTRGGGDDFYSDESD